MNIENDASHIICCVALQKSLSRAEGFCRKVMGIQQARKSPDDAWFVVDNRNYLSECGQSTGAIDFVRRSKYETLKKLLADYRVWQILPLSTVWLKACLAVDEFRFSAANLRVDRFSGRIKSVGHRHKLRKRFNFEFLHDAVTMRFDGSL